jgi:Rod binding domain-containing protein
MADFRISNFQLSDPSVMQAKSDIAFKSLRNKSALDTSSKINKAAHDFESILVGQWLEKAEKSFASVPGTDPDQASDSAHDQFQSIACESLAKGITKKGGFGIAAMISKRLTVEEANRPAEDKQMNSTESLPQVPLPSK